MISRRTFLLGLGGIGAVGVLGAVSTTPISLLLSGQKHWLVSGCSDKKGSFFAAAFDLQGQLINKVALPARAHQVIPMKSKPGHALVFARRPGHYAVSYTHLRAHET